MTIGGSPYVGPRAYRVGERLFGRDREARELLRLLVAERVVLLYSPSGAGKTSLLAAKILSELKGQEFQVLDIARVVGSETETGSHNGTNPYVSSVLSYWEEGRPEGTEPIDDLHGIDLNGYLTQRSWIRDNPASTLLVLDQFEEILNQNGRDRGARIEFFQQLGAALQDRDRWAIIAMREEYVAGLDPFLDLLPTRLATRYRLSLLDTETAKEAIRGPAKLEGVEYDADALERLVGELTVVREGGKEAYRTEYVEPLHLQVACRRLWHRLPHGTTKIQEELVDTCGTVAEALAGYYRDAVQTVAGSTEAIKARCDESTIRDWFENDLVSASGQRDQVQSGAEKTGRLPNALVKEFETHYLVRSELRRGARWYEISHDRLVEAIKSDNQAWYDTYEAEATPVALLRKHVRRWSRLQQPGGRDGADAELLSGDDLRKVEEWAKKNLDVLSSQDRDFIQASQRQRQTVRRRWAAVGALAVLMICANLAASTFYAQKRRLQRAQDELVLSFEKLEASQWNQLARKLLADSTAARWRQDDHELSVLLALQADKVRRRAERAQPDPALETNVGDTLRGVLQTRPFTFSPQLDGRRGLLPGKRAFSRDGKAIAVESDGNRIDIVEVDGEPSCRRPALQANARLERLEYSPNGRHLIATTDQDLEIFRESDFGCTRGNAPTPLAPWRTIPFETPALGCVVKDGSLILLGEANRVSAWTLGEDTPPSGNVVWSETSTTTDGGPTAIACASDGSWLVLGTGTGQMTAFLDPLSGSAAPIRFANTIDKWPKAIRDDLAFAKSTLSLEVTALVPWHDRTLFGIFKQGPAAIVVLPDGTRQAPSLAYLSLTRDSVAALAARAAFGRPQRSARMTNFVRGAFDPFGSRLVVANERAIGIWSLSQLFDADDAKTPLDGTKLPSRTEVYAAYREISGPRNGIEALSILDDGKTIAGADAESSVRLSRLDAPARAVYAEHKVALARNASAAGVIYGLRFSDDGQRLAVGGSRYLSFVQVEPDSLTMRSMPDDPCVSASVRAIARGAGEPWVAWAVQDKGIRVAGCQAQTTGVKNAVWVARDEHPEDPQRLELPDSQGLWSVALSGPHHVLAAADYAGMVWLWARDPLTGAPRPDTRRRVSASDAVPVRALAFHPSLPLLAFGTERGAIEIWRLTPSDEGSGDPVRLGTLPHILRRGVRALAFSPDGKQLVFGDDGGTLSLVRVGDAPSAWTVSAETTAHSGGVMSVAFCDDRPGVKGCDPNVFASAGNDGRVRLWRVVEQPDGARLEPQLTFEGSESAVLSVTFSPDGGLIAAGDSDGKLHLWPVDPQRLVRGGCDVVRRNLSLREWKRYVGDGLPYECTCPDLPPGAQATTAGLDKESGCGSQLASGNP
jgi:WD40 repeat protein